MEPKPENIEGTVSHVVEWTLNVDFGLVAVALAVIAVVFLVVRPFIQMMKADAEDRSAGA